MSGLNYLKLDSTLSNICNTTPFVILPSLKMPLNVTTPSKISGEKNPEQYTNIIVYMSVVNSCIKWFWKKKVLMPAAFENLFSCSLSITFYQTTEF